MSIGKQVLIGVAVALAVGLVLKAVTGNSPSTSFTGAPGEAPGPGGVPRGWTVGPAFSARSGRGAF